jgi:flagellar hook assembly protein FlgD
VRIGVYDVHGRLVRMLRDGVAAAGTHHLTWDGFDDHGEALAPGTYLTRMVFGARTLTEELLLIR